MGDNPLVSTGYGSTWYNLLSRWPKLKPNWKFMHVGWQTMDRKHETKEGYIQLPSGKEEMGKDTVLSNLLNYNVDYLITMADVGKQGAFMAPIFEAKKRGWRGKWIMYTPIDTHRWAIYWDDIFASPDINLACAKFGEQQMKKHNAPNIKMIPLGVDSNVFFPRKDREELREKFGLTNKFVIGFVGRNQIRKAIAYWIGGFAKFAKGKDDVILLLHTDALPPAGEGRGWLIDGLVWQCNQIAGEDFFQTKKIQFTQSKLDLRARQKISEEEMNNIYNLMDIYLYPTGGEGFGIPALESQAAGVPILMSDNTTGPELIKHGELIKVLKDVYNRPVSIIGTNGVNNLMPDDNHIAELLEKYYLDWKSGGKCLKEMSIKSREFIKNYNWDAIAKQWIDLFEHET